MLFRSSAFGKETSFQMGRGRGYSYKSNYSEYNSSPTVLSGRYNEAVPWNTFRQGSVISALLKHDCSVHVVHMYVIHNRILATLSSEIHQQPMFILINNDLNNCFRFHFSSPTLDVIRRLCCTGYCVFSTKLREIIPVIIPSRCNFSTSEISMNYCVWSIGS